MKQKRLKTTLQGATENIFILDKDMYKSISLEATSYINNAIIDRPASIN